MLGNIHNIDRNNISVTDTCGRRVLGMSGSLTSYIKTGKAYKRDSFTRSNKPISKSKKEEKLLKRIAAIGFGAIGILAALKMGPKALGALKDKASGVVSKLPKIDILGSIKKIFKK